MWASDVRQILRFRALMEKLVGEYLAKVGLKTYLSQMLGPLATVPVAEVQMYDARKARLMHNAVYSHMELQQYIAEFMHQSIPWMVIHEGNCRYL